MARLYTNLYDSIVSIDNIFAAWSEFCHDKRSKADVMRLEWNLETELFRLHRELINQSYQHGPYQAFYVHDPKQRLIHKAVVRDRVLHHALFMILNPIFEPTFIPASFSCRIGKGTHKGVLTVAQGARKVSKNNTGPCFALKCDIQKFFASVNQEILLGILCKRIDDERTTDLLEQLVHSFGSVEARKGLPIGNLTSQLFANVYMNELDQFVKHGLRVKHYFRYTDDFVILSSDQDYLEQLLPQIGAFLGESLQLKLHPHKVSIRKFTQGIDFLGYVILPHHIVMRTKTRRRIERKVEEKIVQYQNGAITAETFNQSWQSYLGVLSHAKSFNLTEQLKNRVWYETSDQFLSK
jgi:retron-type reverse transcriptase